MSIQDNFDFSVLPGQSTDKCPASFLYDDDHETYNAQGELVNQRVKKLFISIKNPDGFGEIVRIPSEEDMFIYQAEYNAFINGQEYKGEKGTPLEKLKDLDAPQVKKLQSLGIYTLEAFANASDLVVKRFGMGGANLQVRAKAFLKLQEQEQAKEKSIFVDEKLSTAESEIAELKRQIAALAEKKAK